MKAEAVTRRSLCARESAGFKGNRALTRHFLPYILNIVKHIQDYYASILGEFEMVVLLTLLRLGNGAWGAAIRRDIHERIGRELPVSVVYVTLQRLEKKGMVRSYVGDPSAERGGRRRRHYLIDTPGEHALGRSYRAFRKLSEGIEERLLEL
jgi:PadR family transcriptional regulator, regulatory protein PadR